MNLLEVLRHYENRLGVSISVEARNPIFFQSESLKLAPDQYLHHSPFCRFAKLHDNNAVCAANKERSWAIAAHGRCFSGLCPFGIWEYAAPVMWNRQLVAVLYLGNRVEPGWTKPDGYRGVPPGEISDALRREIRETAGFLRRFLAVELDIAARRGTHAGKRRDEDFYVENCRSFIDCRYLENIALTDLADLLGVNANYLGPLLKKRTGSTFRQMLLRRRVDEALIYLRLHPYMPIGEVARLCGFADSNYFSTVFRRLHGVSPRGGRASEPERGREALGVHRDVRRFERNQ